jgi:hypothetical protein
LQRIGQQEALAKLDDLPEERFEDACKCFEKII